jgi:predicted esterase
MSDAFPRPDARTCTLETSVHGRYIVVPPLQLPPAVRILLGFHGYGEPVEAHLNQLRTIPGADAWLTVAVQALHRFYTKPDVVGASWMTRQDRDLAIRDNVAYVNRVVAAVRAEWRTAGPVVFLGFSQGASMAYRAAVLGAERAAAVIALGGDIPPELRAQGLRQFPPALIARGTRDTWYTAEKLESDVACLRQNGTDVQALTFDGGHEWTDVFRQAAGTVLRQAADSQS